MAIAVTPSRRTRSLSVRWDVLGLRWATILGLLVIWQLVAMVGFGGSTFVLPPTEVASAVPGLLDDPDALHALGVTAVEFVAAFVIAVTAGLAIAAILGATSLSRRSGLAIVQLLVSVPQVAMYPLFILFLGVGEWSKIVFGVTHGILPVVIVTVAALESYRSNLPQAVRAMGGGRWSVVRHAVLPAITPNVVAGIRLCAALSLLGILIAELLAATAGVGRQIGTFSAALEIGNMYALIAIVCAAAIAVNTMLAALERRAGRWRP